MKRSRFAASHPASSHGRASSSSVVDVVEIDAEDARSSVLSEENSVPADALRAFVLDLWKHKKLSDKDICTLSFYASAAGFLCIHSFCET